LDDAFFGRNLAGPGGCPRGTVRAVRGRGLLLQPPAAAQAAHGPRRPLCTPGAPRPPSRWPCRSLSLHH